MFIFSAIFILVASLCSALFLHFGWVTLPQLVASICGFSALSSLLAVITVPWNLYFESVELSKEQEISQSKDICLEEEDIKFTKSLPKKMLFLALGLHLTGFGVSYFLFSVAQIYWLEYLAYAFLLSTVLRPLSAMYQNLRTRLLRIRSRTFIPRKDSMDLYNQIRELEFSLRDCIERQTEQEMNSQQKNQVFELQINAIDKKTQQNARSIDEKVDTLLREFESSLIKLQANQEILSGLKALVKMVKSS